MKKKYNPFKMWGSWIGLAVVVIFFREAYLGLLAGGWGTAAGQCSVEFASDLAKEQMCISIMYGALIMSIFVFPIIGFLIGWGVQSLIRRYR